jgi:uncharacterized protein
VKEQLRLLIELQRVDSEILVKKRLMEEIPSSLSDAESHIKKFQAACEKVKQRFDSLELKKRSKERELDDMNEKINKLKVRTAEIKTNKEYQAHLKEIETAEKERYAAEDEILSVMEEVEALSKEIKSDELKLITENKKIEELKERLEREMLEAEKELLPLKESRAKIVDAIDGDIYKQYVDLFEACGGSAVTEVKEEICQGCNMNIPPQLFVEIKRGEEIFQCPQCRRILYYKDGT